MCPHGYHHSGSMATPALGTRDVRLHIVWIALWSHHNIYVYIYFHCILDAALGFLSVNLTQRPCITLQSE